MLDFESQSSIDDARLGALARRDAARMTPRFSQDLHAKIMRSVTASTPGSAQVEPMLGAARSDHPLMIVRHPWLVPMSVAAAIALVAAPGSLRLLRQSAPVAVAPVQAPADSVERRADVEPAVLVIDQTAFRLNARVKNAVRTAMVEQQWAGLDHDVRSAARFLVDEVPLRASRNADCPHTPPTEP